LFTINIHVRGRRVLCGDRRSYGEDEDAPFHVLILHFQTGRLDKASPSQSHPAPNISRQPGP
jgi:hypothetical protein